MKINEPTISVDPRDRSNNDLTQYARRWTLDDFGRRLYDSAPENDYQALMECAPGEEPATTCDVKTQAVNDAMATLTEKEYVVITSHLSYRDLSIITGWSKSALHRARQSGYKKLKEQLAWLMK